MHDMHAYVAHVHAPPLLLPAGQNEQVRIALGQPPIRGRGLRVLSMDGGGMKGLTIIESLRQVRTRWRGVRRVMPAHACASSVACLSSSCISAQAAGAPTAVLTRAHERVCVQLERRAGAPVWSLFDVIGGTSTGGLLAVALGILRLNLDEASDIYTSLSNKARCMRRPMLCSLPA